MIHAGSVASCVASHWSANQKALTKTFLWQSATRKYGHRKAECQVCTGYAPKGGISKGTLWRSILQSTMQFFTSRLSVYRLMWPEELDLVVHPDGQFGRPCLDCQCSAFTRFIFEILLEIVLLYLTAVSCPLDRHIRSAEQGEQEREEGGTNGYFGILAGMNV